MSATASSRSLGGSFAFTFGVGGPAVNVRGQIAGASGLPGDAATHAVLWTVYPFSGFVAPVAGPPTVNVVHAGQSVPIRFQLGGNQGLNVLAAGFPQVQQVNCAIEAPINTATETATAGGSGLQFDTTTGTYTYVWKTDKASAGTCQVFTLGLNDGSLYTAYFQLK